MTKEQVLAAMRKNWLSITFGVCMLLFIGVMLFVINPRIQTLQGEVSARAAKQNEATQLATAERPNLQASPAARAEENNLQMFPTDRVIQWGTTTIRRVQTQAEDVLQRASTVNRRLPLGSQNWEEAAQRWPLEGDARATDRAAFRREYMRYINAGNNFNVETGRYPDGSLQAQLGGTRAPTSEELQALVALNQARIEARAEDQQLDADALRQRIAEEQVRFTNSIKYSRALNGMIYIDPNGPNTGFSVHPIVGTERPTAADCFNAQVGLWVQETVASNLVRANREMLSGQTSDRQNLLHAPVKHLMSITVPPSLVEGLAPTADEGDTREATPAPTGVGGFGVRPQVPGGDTGMRRGQATTPAQPRDEPQADPGVELPTDPTVEIQRDYRVSPSGRPLHTPFYDIVQFNVMVRCDAAHVPYVLTQLQRDSFVTVLNVDVAYVDLAQAAQRGYFYGDRPVVELDLQCEMIFLRPWTRELMPASLRQALAGGAGQDTMGGDEFFEEF